MKFDNFYINGFPKTGNHALLKACELLGVNFDINHQPFTAGWPQGKDKQILIKRDPRNILVSWLRFKRHEVTPGTFMANFRFFQKDTMAKEMAEFEGWLTDPNTLVVAYEDLVKDKTCMEKIATFLGAPYIEGAFEHLEGFTKTYHKVHSDYKTIWNAELQKFWDEEAGELLTRWGY